MYSFSFTDGHSLSVPLSRTLERQVIALQISPICLKNIKNHEWLSVRTKQFLFHHTDITTVLLIFYQATLLLKDSSTTCLVQGNEKIHMQVSGYGNNCQYFSLMGKKCLCNRKDKIQHHVLKTKGLPELLSRKIQLS